MEPDYRIENCLIYGCPDGRYGDTAVRCDVCGRAIYIGEDFYDFFGENVCDECEFEYVLKNFHRYL